MEILILRKRTEVTALSDEDITKDFLLEMVGGGEHWGTDYCRPGREARFGICASTIMRWDEMLQQEEVKICT